MKTTDILQQGLKVTTEQFHFCIDSEGTFLSANQTFSQTFFIQGNETPSSFYKLLSTEGSEFFKEVLENSKKDLGKTLEFLLPCELSNKKTIEGCWQITAANVFGNLIFTLYGEEVVGKNVQEKETSVPALNYQNHHFTSTLLEKILNYSLDLICAVDEDGRFVIVSDVCKNIWGYEVEELVGQLYIDHVYEEDKETTIQAANRARGGDYLKNFENRYVKKDGSLITMFWTARWDEKDHMMYCVARDGTLRKLHEQALKASKEKYKLLFFKNPQPMWIYDVNTLQFLEVNEIAIESYGYSREEFLTMNLLDIRPKDEAEKLIARKSSSNSRKKYWKHKKKNGEVIDVEITAYPLVFEGHDAKLVLSYDVTEQLEAEAQLIRSNERYIYASKATFDAIWDWDLQSDEVHWSEGYEVLFGYKLENNKERETLWSEHIHPADKERVMTKLESSLKYGEPKFEAEYRFKKADNTYAYVIDRGIVIRDENNIAYRMIGAMQDYTQKEKNEQALKELNASLERRASELASSNKELERFAYVASHDLQEPLRMVSSFLQLLQKRYKNLLDDKGNEYIHFAVDGAERMKTLILDLLKYSRVNTMKEEHELVNLNEIGNNILATYKQVVEETKAEITIDTLPSIVGTKTQLAQLFQNLVGNALKYRSTKPPKIHVSVTEQDHHWQFAVQDNGIGIDPRFYEKIFVIFQRLHHKDEYSGTGIGLAICKKIVERHRGKIWVESSANGSTFYFTIKKNLKLSS